eukprot:scaffold511_cov412-Pavlova_lutheri.AAC.7
MLEGRNPTEAGSGARRGPVQARCCTIAFNSVCGGLNAGRFRVCNGNRAEVQLRATIGAKCDAVALLHLATVSGKEYL